MIRFFGLRIISAGESLPNVTLLSNSRFNKMIRGPIVNRYPYAVLITSYQYEKYHSLTSLWQYDLTKTWWKAARKRPVDLIFH